MVSQIQFRPHHCSEQFYWPLLLPSSGVSQESGHGQTTFNVPDLHRMHNWHLLRPLADSVPPVRWWHTNNDHYLTLIPWPSQAVEPSPLTTALPLQHNPSAKRTSSELLKISERIDVVWRSSLFRNMKIAVGFLMQCAQTSYRIWGSTVFGRVFV